MLHHLGDCGAGGVLARLVLIDDTCRVLRCLYPYKHCTTRSDRDSIAVDVALSRQKLEGNCGTKSQPYHTVTVAVNLAIPAWEE